MGSYILRLDDASYACDKDKWERMESLLFKQGIKPLVGVIPNCEDPQLLNYNGYETEYFWENKVLSWVNNGWVIAMHGYNHVFCSNSSGINPMNNKSEFAGLDLEKQREKIRDGVSIMQRHNIYPKVFFAPAHTFDDNTLMALKIESNIRMISDIPSNGMFCYKGFTFVPQQSGRVRNLPFSIVTFCYHPNIMSEKDFEILEMFLKKNKAKFIQFPIKQCINRKSFLDNLVIWAYFTRDRVQKTFDKLSGDKT